MEGVIFVLEYVVNYPNGGKMDDAKLCWLVLDRELKTFKELQQELFLDSTAKLHRALRYLATRGLIHTHPLLMVKKPNRHAYAKLRAVNCQVKDRSLAVLLWALSEDEEIVQGKPDSYYLTRIRQMALRDRRDIDMTEHIREELKSL
jgi:hypothetical protein